MGDHDPQKCNEYGATKTKEFKIKTLAACKLIVVVANMSMRGLPTVLKAATSLLMSFLKEYRRTNLCTRFFIAVLWRTTDNNSTSST
jgi:hypothetical protein